MKNREDNRNDSEKIAIASFFLFAVMIAFAVINAIIEYFVG